MPIFAVHYTYSDDASARRETFLPEHRAWVVGLADIGTIVESGRYGDWSGALIIFRGADANEVRKLLEDEPFNREGLAGEVRVVEWMAHFGAIKD